MKYFVSDIHGEYKLFVELLEKIKFSESDEMYICGDVIDKGSEPIKLARFVSSLSNVHCILGNHEYEFLKYYHSLLHDSPNDFDAVLTRLREYFSDGHLLDWQTVDWIDSLPSYIENEDFICTHAGVPLDSKGNILPLENASVEHLVNDRRFKEPAVKHKDARCVFFGHTQTNCICGEARIIGYKRSGVKVPESIRDIYKVHLDTGAWSNGVLGCFCLDTLKVVYARKK